jgi:hypothetical protein
MNAEAARFNMIRQSIRAWNALDPGVPAALSEAAFNSENLFETRLAALDDAPRLDSLVFRPAGAGRKGKGETCDRGYPSFAG